MRRQGKLTKWKDDQGFGFITPNGGGEQVFVHIKSFSNRQRRPLGNEIVTYEVFSDENGRTRAEKVAFMGDTSIPARGGTGFALPVLFLMLVATFVFLGRLPFAILGFYLAVSGLAFRVYAYDKSAAQKGQWRISEGTLHILGLTGGWPGAFVAQKFLRHKSRKQSFRVVFWTTVVLNGLGLAWLLTPPGAAALRSFLTGLN